MSAAAEARWSGLAGNLAWNLTGESLPVLAAAVAIPILVHRLGTDRFGVLTLSWMIAGYFGLFDFGLGRALTKAMAQELSLGQPAKAAVLFWTTLAIMLALGALAGATLSMLTPWLTRSALKIPVVLQGETRAGFYLIAIGLPMLVSTSALRAALTAADRFDLLNLVRTPSGIMSFAAPVLILPFTHNLAWLIAALILNRAMAWAVYFAVTMRAVAGLRSSLRIDLACVSPLLSFGAWITVSSVITPMMVYLDRFLIGALLSMAALTAYSVPMEIVSKSFLPAAVSGVIFPAFARSFVVAPAAIAHLFGRSLKLIALILCPLCAAVVTFAPQIISLWMGPRFAPQSAAVLQILAVGAFATGLAWIPLALLHGAHRPDLAAKIHLVDFPLYALVMWAFIRRFGLSGAAFAWSGRLLAENLVLFAMVSRFVAASRREVVAACALLILAIAVVVAGAFIEDNWMKAIFISGVVLLAGVAGWRSLLDRTERAQIIGYLPHQFGPAFGKFSN